VCLNPEKAKEMNPPGKGNEEQVSKEGPSQETDRHKKSRPLLKQSGLAAEEAALRSGRKSPGSLLRQAGQTGRSIENDR
jgi:hypothetical protein